MPEDNTPMVEEANGIPDPIGIPTNTPTTTEFATENAAIKPRRRQVKPAGGTKKPVKPNRRPEDCFMEDPKKMTDKEKDDVIRFYQGAIKDMQNRYATLDRNTQGAFAQARKLQDENERIKREAATKINLLKQNISTLFQNSLLVNLEVGNNDN